ncbi:unnamed protein product, partial [Meganyctiphanes norvegica]
MSADDGGNITPPPTPDMEGEKPDDFMDSESLDYMDFFTNELDSSPQKQQPVISKVGSNEPLWFSCSGELRWKESIKDHSLIGRGALKTVKYGIMPYNGSFGVAVFDIPCQPEDLHYEIEQYFSYVRQGFLELERGAHSRASVSRSFHDDRYSKIRYNIAEFYSLLSNHVYSLESPKENEDFFFDLLIKIKEILVFIGPFYSLPDHVTSAGSSQGNESSSAAFHLLHAHLDVRWHTISLLHQLNLIIGHLSPPINADMASSSANLLTETQLGSQVNGPNSTPSLLDQVFLLIMWDAITILTREGIKKNLNDLQHSVGFSCSCSHELMLMMLHLIEYRGTTLGNQCFWDYITPCLLSLLKNETSLMSSELGISSQNNVSSSHNVDHKTSSEMDCFTISFPPSVVKSLRLPHIWWIFTNIVKLYGFDENGKKLPPKSNRINIVQLKAALIYGWPFSFRTTKKDTKIEYKWSKLRILRVHRCRGRSSQWAASLWDYFSRNLDSSFMLPGAGVDGLACMSKTASGWLEQVKSLRVDSNASSLGKNTTSWQNFLQVILSVVESSNTEWKRIRGRIYSQFHPQQMTKLQPLGLYNSITLFLAVATATDISDVSIKLCELLSFVPHSSSIGKLRIVVRGFMTVALLRVSSGCDVSLVVEKIAPLIIYACKEYKNGLDAMHRRDMIQLLACYAEGVQEVLEQSDDLSLNQHKLFQISGETSSLSMVIRDLSGSEMRALLSAMEAALRRVLILADARPFHSDDTGCELVDVIWRDFSGFIKEHAISGTPPAVLGTTAAALTLARLQTYKSSTIQGAKEAAENFFIYFVTKEVNPVCMVQYMSEVLSYPGSQRLLGLISENYASQIVSGWITSVLIHGNTDELSVLTSTVLELPEIDKIIPRTSNKYSFFVLETLVKSLATMYDQAPDFASRLSVREQALKYLSGLDKALVVVMKKVPLPAHIGQLVDLIATLFATAPGLIYVKGRQTLPLPSLISAVLLPTSVYSPEKPLPAALASALPAALPKMLCGIASLGISQDQFLRRNLRDIFTHYMYRFSIKTEKNYTTVLHPFIVCLHDADTNDATLQDLRGIFLEAARDNYIAKRGCNLSHIQAVMLLLCELLSRSSVEWIESMCHTVLLPVLEVLLVVSDESTKRKTNDLLKEIMVTAARLDKPPRIAMMPPVNRSHWSHTSWCIRKSYAVLWAKSLVIMKR